LIEKYRQQLVDVSLHRMRRENINVSAGRRVVQHCHCSALWAF